jgi:hypothetical protein
MVNMLLTACGVGSEEISGRELACYLVMSELLSTLVKQKLLNQDQVHHILWNAGMRLHYIRCDVGESNSLEDEGQHLLNLIEEYVDFSKKRTCA